MLIFDIETSPLPEDQLRELLPPFDDSSVANLLALANSEFDPSTVVIGNLKDQAKIDAKIADARAKFNQARADAPRLIEQAKANHWQEFVSRAALSAITGRVIAIGYLATETGQHVIDHGDGDELKLIESFWAKYAKCRASGRRMVGHNCNSFDVPFLMRRAWLLGIEVPATVLDKLKWLDPIFVDTMALWGCGGREPVKLDVLGQAFGVGRKTEGINGGDFHKLWFGTAEDRAKAVEYLVQDLRLTAAVAQKMCLI